VNIHRTLTTTLVERTRDYRVTFLTGPRQSGKTTLARSAFPDAAYRSFEDPSVRRRAADDPRGFLDGLAQERGVILDEVQHLPDIFSYLQGYVDEGRGGPYILTGSQNFLLSERISQSLAGRAAVLELLPFSIAELRGRPARSLDQLIDSAPEGGAVDTPMDLDAAMFAGGFPPVHDRGLDPRVWFDSYLRTYVERDVRLVAGIGDLDAFARFVSLCAGRSGSLLNLTSLGADAGVSHTTARKWISVLRATYVIDVALVHAANFSKRLVKTPKLYFLDTGLLCSLLELRGPKDLVSHPLRGAIFETMVYTELHKMATHHGERSRLAFWRDAQGNEVDFVIERSGRLFPIEAKSGRTVVPESFRGLEYFSRLSGQPGGLLVYGGEESIGHRGFGVRPWSQLS